MKPAPTKKAYAYLHQHLSPLQIVFEKVRRLETINQRISAHLDPTLKDYCRVANLNGQQLIMLVANGAIGTALRFQTPDLLRKFKQDSLLKSIKSIQCKTQVHTATERLTTSPTPAQSMPPLSAETADLIRHSALSLSDPALKSIMQRIASHIRDEK